MSRSLKRSRILEDTREAGRHPVVRKTRDGYVAHSKDCYLCGSGTVPNRILFIKPRRNREKRELARIVREELE